MVVCLFVRLLVCSFDCMCVRLAFCRWFVLFVCVLLAHVNLLPGGLDVYFACFPASLLCSWFLLGHPCSLHVCLSCVFVYI